MILNFMNEHVSYCQNYEPQRRHRRILKAEREIPLCLMIRIDGYISVWKQGDAAIRAE